MPITAFLEDNAARFGDEICLTEITPENEGAKCVRWSEFSTGEEMSGRAYRREMTWHIFDYKANQFANFLLAEGVSRGDKVAILMMNSLEWLPVYFGTLKTGALAVPLNYRYTADEIKYCLDLSDSSVLVFGPEFIDRVAAIKDDLPKIKRMLFVGAPCPDFAESVYGLASVCSAEKPDVAVSDDDFAAIYFSSGTTGFPKAILHKHTSLMHAAICEQKHHGQHRGDNFLCMPPLYHTGAKMHWFGSLVSASPAVLLRGISPKWILKTVSDERCTIVWLLVPWAQDILDAIESGEVKLSDYDLSCWRLMHIGAQPVPPSLVKRWKQYFPNHDYDTNYGLSESIGPGCVHLGIENVRKVGAIGVPGFGWEARLVKDGADVHEAGVVGELAVKGPGVMTCYYHDEQATAESLVDGWLMTGDMAKYDEDGFIYLVDRKKDVIISGGENIYPVQIKDFLRTNGKIKDVAVIGRPHKRLGEIAAAIIELKPGCDASVEEMAAFCEALPRYKRPREIIFDRVPRNPTGKIEKPRLREKYGVSNLVEQQSM